MIITGSFHRDDTQSLRLGTGKGDVEMLAWIQKDAPHKRTPWKIQQWSAYFCERGPGNDVEALEMFWADKQI